MCCKKIKKIWLCCKMYIETPIAYFLSLLIVIAASVTSAYYFYFNTNIILYPLAIIPFLLTIFLYYRCKQECISLVLVLLGTRLSIYGIVLNPENTITLDRENVLIGYVSYIVHKMPYGLVDFLKSFLPDFFLTLGIAMLTIALFNVAYQWWHDLQSQKNLIGSIYGHASKLIPSIPVEISHWDFLEKSLIKSLLSDNEKTKRYVYVGTGMTTFAEIVVFDDVKDGLEATFIIPDPKIVDQDERNVMRKNVKGIIEEWKKIKNNNKNMTLTFHFLNYLPQFHMHLTNKECWLAFVDKSKIKSSICVKNGLPVTYKYNKSDDNFVMYDMIENSIDRMIAKEDYYKERVVFKVGQSVLKMGKKVPVEITAERMDVMKHEETEDAFLRRFD